MGRLTIYVSSSSGMRILVGLTDHMSDPAYHLSLAESHRGNHATLRAPGIMLRIAAASASRDNLFLALRASLETLASLFPWPDLINILDKYWEILKVYGLFVDQSREPFQWSNAINSPVHVQRR
jgi:hypothetical protein